MKRKILVFATIIVASAGIGVAADAAANWSQLCASCHGKDGSGNTTMGKKLGVKDYSKEQGFSDAGATNVIKNGKGQDEGIQRQAVRCRRKGVGGLRSFVKEIMQ